jgi:hypothetical protein
MAKDEYLEIADLDTTSESEKLTMALVYVTTIFLVAAIIFFQMKMKEYGVGFLSD